MQRSLNDFDQFAGKTQRKDEGKKVKLRNVMHLPSADIQVVLLRIVSYYKTLCTRMHSEQLKLLP